MSTEEKHKKIEVQDKKVETKKISKLPPIEQINKEKVSTEKVSTEKVSAEKVSTEKTSKDQSTKEKSPKEKDTEDIQSTDDSAKSEENMVQLGEGLPALPPKPQAPKKQAIPSASPGLTPLRQRVPNVNQVSKPQVNNNISPDLGVVGKIGAYQVANSKPVSAAADVHANIIFWFYLITLFTTFFIMKKSK